MQDPYASLPYWLVPSYRRVLLRDAIRSTASSRDAAAFRRSASLFKRYLQRKVLGGHVQKMQAVWQALRYANARTVLDIGSLDGADAVELSRLFPEATIHAFEPDPLNFGLVEKETSWIPRIRPWQVAASDETGTCTFFAAGHKDSSYVLRASGSLLKPKEVTKEWWPSVEFDRHVEVPSTTIDNWSCEHSIDEIDLIWMDVQGAELKVLSGMSEMLSHTRCILLEVWMKPAYEGCPMLDEVRDFLESRGFFMTNLWQNINQIDGDAMFQRLG